MVPYTNSRPPLPAGVHTLPAECYADPDWFVREMQAIYFDMWLCAGRAEQLPRAGAYVVRQFGSANVILVRTEHGGFSAFHNVCRHRGTRLCDALEGTLNGQIQCPYHAWTYALDGALVSAPHMDKVEGFRREDHALRSVAVAEWDGHLFINLSPEPMSFSDHLAGLDQKFRPWHMEELRSVEREVYELRTNWKLIIQNYSECLHCPVAHPLFNRQTHYLSGDNEPPMPTYLGGRMDLREGVQTHSIDGLTNRKCLGTVAGVEARSVYYYAILPNLLLNLHPDYMLTFTLWPLAADRTRVVCEWFFHPDAIAAPDFDPRGAIEFWRQTNREDWALSEAAQAGISSAGYEPGRYSNREELLIALDRWILDKVSPLPPIAAPRSS